ncbi:MAG: 50S ribosomal protein L13 [Planctomycetes bacterium]|jgi:large subunit ribosomal protein L13|nr:50S ribosomal protein L13 [Phycisphaerae bacterium]NBB94255.1 50S ribosomal protein L13 [Planctomycetota bacterium]
MAKPGEIEKQWYLIDAAEQVVGRLAARIAPILQGKHRPAYTPHVDCGDFVVVINAEKVKLTGANKPRERVHKRYSGYPGGQKETTAAEMLVKHPDRVIQEAVRRMMPKTKLGEAMCSKLKVYAGSEHPHQAQQPEALEL